MSILLKVGKLIKPIDKAHIDSTSVNCKIEIWCAASALLETKILAFPNYISYSLFQ